MPEILSMTTSSEKYLLLQMHPNSNTISVAAENFVKGNCPEKFSNTTVNFTLFSYTPATENVTLYYECSFLENPQIQSINLLVPIVLLVTLRPLQMPALIIVYLVVATAVYLFQLTDLPLPVLEI